MCGVAHVASSVLIGSLGVGLGVALSSLEWFEAARGYWVAWALVGFGCVYAMAAIVNLRRRTPHRHPHVLTDGTVQRRFHGHGLVERSNVSHHAPETNGEQDKAVLRNGNIVASLFVVFLLGPCEALLPLMTAPTLRGDVTSGLLVALVFGAATLTTMLTLVAVGWFGMKWHKLMNLEPHLHWISGMAIASSGLAILVLGV